MKPRAVGESIRARRPEHREARLRSPRPPGRWPDASPSTSASTRHRRQPTARSTPISRVRSKTDIIIVLSMPTEPEDHRDDRGRPGHRPGQPDLDIAPGRSPAPGSPRRPGVSCSIRFLSGSTERGVSGRPLDHEAGDLPLPAHHRLERRQGHDQRAVLEQAVALEMSPTTRNGSPATSIGSPTFLPRFSASTRPSMPPCDHRRAEARPSKHANPAEEQAARLPAVDQDARQVRLLEADGVHQRGATSATPSISIRRRRAGSARLLESWLLLPARTTTMSIPFDCRWSGTSARSSRRCRRRTITARDRHRQARGRQRSAHAAGAGGSGGSA